MLDIRLLRNGRRDGLEFIDFQNYDFAIALTAAVANHIKKEDGKEVLLGTVAEEILPIIEKYTGFKNIKTNMINEANFMVDTGYMSPNNVLNIKNIEQWYDITETSLYNWYKKEKNKVFKGAINYSEGKVYGAYADIPIELWIGKPVYELFNSKEVQRLGCTLAEVVAACLCHELGHAFSAVAMIDVAANDNFVMRAALNALRREKTPSKRVIIIRDVSKLLEGTIETKDDIDKMGEHNDSEILVYFNALVNRRNSRRALSLGVADMSSEVLADVYALRMGFSKGLVVATHAFAKTRVSSIVFATWIAFVYFMLLMGVITGAAGFGVILALAFTMGAFGLIYNAMSFSGSYNSPFRRFEDAVRQVIARLKEVKDMPPKEKADLAEFAATMLKECEKYKPFIAGTFIERFMGVLWHGGDFKASEFEHFTQAIANSELELLNINVSNLKA